MALAACQGQRPQDDERPAADTQVDSSAAQANAQPVDSGNGASVPPAAADTVPAPARPAQDTLFAGTTEPLHRTRTAPPVAVLSDVRAAAHGVYDRVVFEFASEPLPGYHIEYASGPVYQCGSGDEVNVAAAARLVVRLEPAQAHDDRGNVTITERQRTLALPIVKELVILCDFEAQVEWVAGLAARAPYRVTELSAPPRLVLDVRH
jgi:hypothetical protein